jgi:hypothetical protein
LPHRRVGDYVAYPVLGPGQAIDIPGAKPIHQLHTDRTVECRAGVLRIAEQKWRTQQADLLGTMPVMTLLAVTAKSRLRRCRPE